MHHNWREKHHYRQTSSLRLHPHLYAFVLKLCFKTKTIFVQTSVLGRFRINLCPFMYTVHARAGVYGKQHWTLELMQNAEFNCRTAASIDKKVGNACNSLSMLKLTCGGRRFLLEKVHVIGA